MIITNYKTELAADKRCILVKESAFRYAVDRFSNPELLAELMSGHYGLDKRSEEYVYVIGMTKSFRPIGVFEVFHGAADESIVSSREIFTRLLLVGAVCFVLVHNHPSGDPAPSKEDVMVTSRIKKNAQMLNMPFVDHIIIIGEDGTYFSLRESEML